jgi:hypothetical protein
MTICTSIDTLAMVYLDAELADEELRDFEMHMRECAACRGRVDAEREMIAKLRRGLATASAPGGLRARLTRDLDAEDRTQERVIRRRRIASWALLAGILAALALLVFMPREAHRSSVVQQVAELRMRSPRVAIPLSWSGDTSMVVHRAAEWDQTLPGRDRWVARVYMFQIVGRHDEAAVIQSLRFDSRGEPLPGDRFLVDGVELGVFRDRTGYDIVFHCDIQGMVYAFLSDDLGWPALSQTIVHYHLIEQMR